jgi:type II secretory pathway pseudopilin PulG
MIPRPASESGFSLLETVFALGILAVVALGILPLGFIAVSATENQGHLMARTTEYAQDKIEQLQGLAFGDTSSDTRVFPATFNNGSGLAEGGSSNPAAPVALYVDWLDVKGNVLTSVGTAAPDNWYYERVWSIAPVRTNLKLITVTAIVKAASNGGSGIIPQSTLSVLKTSPF